VPYYKQRPAAESFLSSRQWCSLSKFSHIFCNMHLFPSAQEFANQVRGAVQNNCNILHFTIRNVYPLTQPPGWRTVLCSRSQLSIPYLYSQRAFKSGRRSFTEQDQCSYLLSTYMKQHTYSTRENWKSCARNARLTRHRPNHEFQIQIYTNF